MRVSGFPDSRSAAGVAFSGGPVTPAYLIQEGGVCSPVKEEAEVPRPKRRMRRDMRSIRHERIHRRQGNESIVFLGRERRVRKRHLGLLGGVAVRCFAGRSCDGGGAGERTAHGRLGRVQARRRRMRAGAGSERQCQGAYTWVAIAVCQRWQGARKRVEKGDSESRLALTSGAEE